jgi:DNA-3-methyladenine glycosylase I
VKKAVRRHPDGRPRCVWCGDDPAYVAYHDREWGQPPRQDDRWYEKVCLEGFQAGLSWLTILRKRARFRAAFAGFDPAVVARYGKRDVTRLLGDAGIVRHRGKIESALNNARRALELREECGSLKAFFVRFRSERRTADWVSVTPESQALSKELRARGWTFVGPTTMYALMQATGLVDDHAPRCAFRPAAQESRRRRLGTT